MDQAETCSLRAPRLAAATVLTAAVLLSGPLAGCSGPREIAAPPVHAEVPPPPEVAREFRAAWIATVANIDWPSRPGLTPSRQRSELRTLLDRAVAVGLNAVILQVRPAADALYASPYEPWSEYVTGVMGQAPDPYYDPLEFAVDEAHKRGLELHAWFNPFRARHRTGTSPVSEEHISQRHPALVRTYGDQLWIDPGDPRGREYSASVILDVVRRYDIDGVHMDDYFYPYQIQDSAKTLIDFPDDSTWAAARESGLLTTRSDWRRSNVDRFIERLSIDIKAAKPWVRFGLSPFGIWRPGHPPQIVGHDAYDRLYADARKWLLNGWVDYLSPQLYWEIDRIEQSYPVLLEWWHQQNPLGRHVWPGNYTSRTMMTDTPRYWDPAEIVDQVYLTRSRTSPSGNIHYSIKALLRDNSNVAEALAGGPYVEPALVPATTWLGGQAPPRPIVHGEVLGRQVVVDMRSPGADVWLWLVQQYSAGGWRARVVPGWMQMLSFTAEEAPDAIELTAVSRLGLASPTMRLSLSDLKDINSTRP